MTPKISAIICTHNRDDILKGALESLVQQTLDKSLYEIIVVDNASTDETKNIVEQYDRCGTAVRYVYESNLGLSHARNRGAEEAHSEILAFMDDDCLADEHWLEELCRTFEADPSMDAVGGKIELLWLAPKPSWLPQGWLFRFGRWDLGQEPKVIHFPSAPTGGNFSVRRVAFRKAGGFSALLGRKGKNLISGEEGEFFYRLSLLGAKVLYQPKAVIWHKVPANRISKSWIMKRSFAGGVSSAIFTEMIATNPSKLRCLFRGLKAGFIGISYSLRMPVASIIHGGEANNMARVAFILRVFGRAYQNLRIAAGLKS